MAEALFELEEILISRKEALTSEEAKLLNSWKQNAVRDFGIGATGASIATWLVTRRLNNLVRMNLTAVTLDTLSGFGPCISGLGR
ncbi:hypothetical protein KY289_027314 [Solanum tuberosum]|nr:hypothetical protein KY289_027314 [Solanum tuberosum]